MEEGADIPADETDQILYHYCGVSAFRGIITSHEFWLSNIRFMRDATEQKWLIDKAHLQIEERSRTTPSDRDGLEQLATMVDSPNVPCVFCLCSERDCKSQWGGFADGGAGFAIGFPRICIDALCDEHHERTGEAIALRKVEYGEVEQDGLVKGHLDAYSDERAQGYTSATERMSVARASIRIWADAARCKAPKYATENEWRIVWLPRIREMGDYEASAVKSRVDGSRRVSYFALQFGRDAIKQVWLGPKNGERADHPVVERFLRQNGYSVGLDAIKDSEVTWP
jgi:hypothetical protein